MITILVTKNKILVVIDICNYKPCNCLGQMVKDNQSQKTPHGMYSHISLMTYHLQLQGFFIH
jgi:hypothetical protein